MKRATVDLIVGSSLILALGVALLFAAGALDWRVPDVKVVKDAGAAIAAVIFGLVIFAAGGVIIFLSIKKGSILGAIIGGIFLLAGTTTLGIKVGVPGWLEVLANALQALVDLINAIIRGASKIGGAFS